MKRILSGTLALALIVTSWPPASSWAQTPSPELPTTTVSPASFDPAHLDLRSLTVPETLGSIQEIWQPSDGAPDGLVIHLQDLHAHPEAQHHLSELIGYLHDTLGVKLVALEGADGPCDTSFFSAFPDSAVVRRISREFVEHGLFTGGEEYAITHPDQVTLWGVEDAASYLEHLATYRQGVSQPAQPQQTLTALRKTLRSLANRLYPQPLRQLLLLREAADAEQPVEGALTSYITALIRLGGELHVSRTSYPAVQAYARATEVFRTLDLRRAQQDRNALLEALWPRLSASEQTAVRRLVALAKAARIPKGYYEQQVIQLAQAHGVWVSAGVAPDFSDQKFREAKFLWKPSSTVNDYPALQQYLLYLSLVDQSRSPSLMHELDALHQAIEEAVFTTEISRSEISQQRAVAGLLRWSELAENLLAIKLSPEQFTAYHINFASRNLLTETLWQQLTQATEGQLPITLAQLEALTASLRTPERFYDLALTRNDALVRNTVVKLEEQHVPAAILIAGGFHTPGITQALKARNLAYVVIAPKVEGASAEAMYHERLQGQVPDPARVLARVRAGSHALAVASVLNTLGSVQPVRDAAGHVWSRGSYTKLLFAAAVSAVILATGADLSHAADVISGVTEGTLSLAGTTLTGFGETVSLASAPPATGGWRSVRSVGSAIETLWQVMIGVGPIALGGAALGLGGWWLWRQARPWPWFVRPFIIPSFAFGAFFIPDFVVSWVLRLPAVSVGEISQHVYRLTNQLAIVNVVEAADFSPALLGSIFFTLAAGFFLWGINTLRPSRIDRWLGSMFLGMAGLVSGVLGSQLIRGGTLYWLVLEAGHRDQFFNLLTLFREPIAYLVTTAILALGVRVFWHAARLLLVRVVRVSDRQNFNPFLKAWIPERLMQFLRSPRLISSRLLPLSVADHQSFWPYLVIPKGSLAHWIAVCYEEMPMEGGTAHQFAEKFGVSSVTARRRLYQLEQLGLVEVERRQGPHRYRLHPDVRRLSSLTFDELVTLPVLMSATDPITPIPMEMRNEVHQRLITLYLGLGWLRLRAARAGSWGWARYFFAPTFLAHEVGHLIAVWCLGLKTGLRVTEFQVLPTRTIRGVPERAVPYLVNPHVTVNRAQTVFENLIIKPMGWIFEGVFFLLALWSYDLSIGSFLTHYLPGMFHVQPSEGLRIVLGILGIIFLVPTLGSWVVACGDIRKTRDWQEWMRAWRALRERNYHSRFPRRHEQTQTPLSKSREVPGTEGRGVQQSHGLQKDPSEPVVTHEDQGHEQPRVLGWMTRLWSQVKQWLPLLFIVSGGVLAQVLAQVLAPMLGVAPADAPVHVMGLDWLSLVIGGWAGHSVWQGIRWLGQWWAGQEVKPFSTIQTSAVHPFSEAREAPGRCVTGDTVLAIAQQVEGGRSKVEGIPITDVQPGMRVYSLNETTGRLEPRRIKGLLAMGVKPVYRLTTASGRSIRTTGNHPYLTRAGWRQVSALRAGDRIAVSAVDSIAPSDRRDEDVLPRPLEDDAVIGHAKPIHLTVASDQGLGEVQGIGRAEEIFQLLDELVLDARGELAKLSGGLGREFVGNHAPACFFRAAAGTRPDRRETRSEFTKAGLNDSMSSMIRSSSSTTLLGSDQPNNSATSKKSSNFLSSASGSAGLVSPARNACGFQRILSGFKWSSRNLTNSLVTSAFGSAARRIFATDKYDRSTSNVAMRPPSVPFPASPSIPQYQPQRDQLATATHLTRAGWLQVGMLRVGEEIGVVGSTCRPEANLRAIEEEQLAVGQHTGGFFAQPGREPDRRHDVVTGDAGVLGGDVLERIPGGQETQDVRHGDPRAANAGFAEPDLGVDRDPFHRTLKDTISLGPVNFEPIVSIEPVGQEPVYDIEVEGTHNFVANGILAHNTSLDAAAPPARGLTRRGLLTGGLLGGLAAFAASCARLPTRTPPSRETPPVPLATPPSPEVPGPTSRFDVIVAQLKQHFADWKQRLEQGTETVEAVFDSTPIWIGRTNDGQSLILSVTSYRDIPTSSWPIGVGDEEVNRRMAYRLLRASRRYLSEAVGQPSRTLTANTVDEVIERLDQWVEALNVVASAINPDRSLEEMRDRLEIVDEAGRWRMFVREVYPFFIERAQDGDEESQGVLFALVTRYFGIVLSNVLTTHVPVLRKPARRWIERYAASLSGLNDRFLRPRGVYLLLAGQTVNMFRESQPILVPIELDHQEAAFLPEAARKVPIVVGRLVNPGDERLLDEELQVGSAFVLTVGSTVSPIVIRADRMQERLELVDRLLRGEQPLQFAFVSERLFAALQTAVRRLFEPLSPEARKRLTYGMTFIHERLHWAYFLKGYATRFRIPDLSTRAVEELAAMLIEVARAPSKEAADEQLVQYAIFLLPFSGKEFTGLVSNIHYSDGFNLFFGWLQQMLHERGTFGHRPSAEEVVEYLIQPQVDVRAFAEQFYRQRFGDPDEHLSSIAPELPRTLLAMQELLGETPVRAAQVPSPPAPDGHEGAPRLGPVEVLTAGALSSGSPANPDETPAPGEPPSPMPEGSAAAPPPSGREDPEAARVAESPVGEAGSIQQPWLPVEATVEAVLQTLQEAERSSAGVRVGELFSDHLFLPRYPLFDLAGRPFSQFNHDELTQLVRDEQTAIALRIGEDDRVLFTDLTPRGRELVVRWRLRQVIERSRSPEAKRRQDLRNRQVPADLPALLKRSYFHFAPVELMEPTLRNGLLPQTHTEHVFSVDFSVPRWDRRVPEWAASAREILDTTFSYKNLKAEWLPSRALYVVEHTPEGWDGVLEVDAPPNPADFRIVLGGMPATQISAILLSKPQETLGDAVRWVIRNGFYIPLYDMETNLLLSPAEYETFRQHREGEEETRTSSVVPEPTPAEGQPEARGTAEPGTGDEEMGRCVTGNTLLAIAECGMRSVRSGRCRLSTSRRGCGSIRSTRRRDGWSRGRSRGCWRWG